MTDVLVDVLRDRAELAPDSDQMWEDILHGIDARRSRRRATVAAAGASAAVAAAAVTAVIVVPARPHHPAAVPGNQAPVSTTTVSKPSSPPPTVAPKVTRLVPAPAGRAARRLELSRRQPVQHHLLRSRWIAGRLRRQAGRPARRLRPGAAP